VSLNEEIFEFNSMAAINVGLSIREPFIVYLLFPLAMQ
jgi:hypothetical protein